MTPKVRDKEDDSLELRVPLKGKVKEKFFFIKDKHGLENNTDVIRLLITQKYDELEDKSA